MSTIESVNKEFFVKINAGIQYTAKSSKFSFNVVDLGTNVNTAFNPIITENPIGLYNCSFVIGMQGNYNIEITNNELWQSKKILNVNVLSNATTTAVVAPASPVIYKYRSII